MLGEPAGRRAGLAWSLVTFAKSERAALCALLDQVGPDAPTLCEGWLAHDLAAHIWLRETDPISTAGTVAKPLAGLVERRMADVKQRWPFTELVARIRNGPARFSVFAFPGVDEPANATEFFVHHEDVRRARGEPGGARDLGPEVEDWMWRRLKLLGRAHFRQVRVGVVLERLDVAPDASAETIRVVSGSPIVTLIGLPSELMLFAHGRTGAAEVKLIGDPAAIDALRMTELRT